MGNGPNRTIVRVSCSSFTWKTSRKQWMTSLKYWRFGCSEKAVQPLCTPAWLWQKTTTAAVSSVVLVAEQMRINRGEIQDDSSFAWNKLAQLDTFKAQEREEKRAHNWAGEGGGKRKQELLRVRIFSSHQKPVIKPCVFHTGHGQQPFWRLKNVLAGVFVRHEHHFLNSRLDNQLGAFIAGK